MTLDQLNFILSALFGALCFRTFIHFAVKGYAKTRAKLEAETASVLNGWDVDLYCAYTAVDEMEWRDVYEGYYYLQNEGKL